MPIIYDLEGSRFRSAIGNDRWFRRFRCTGLVNGPSPADLYVEALVLVPDKGTSAPAPITGLILDVAEIERIYEELDTDGSPLGTWGCLGTIIYRPPTRTTIGVSIPDKNGPGVTTSTESIAEEYETDVDVVTGNQITTSYDNVTNAHAIRGFRQLRTINFERPEEENPRGRRDTYQGTLNNALWNGYAAGEALMYRIADRTDDNQNWQVSYTIVIREGGWSELVVHEDPYFPGHPLPLAGLSAPEIAAATFNATRALQVDWSGLNITLA